MIKSILKEIIITLLLCTAILLVLSVLFYDYNPLNKIIPNTIAYTTPDEIKNEIAQNEVKDVLEEGINIVYSIDSSDLNIYKKSNSYVAGKQNPFAEIAETVTEEPEGGETVNNKNQTANNGSTSTNKDPDQQGTFLNDAGKK